MEKISGVYKITNIVTNDFYIGSSNNVKKRWADHKCHSTWNNYPNNPLYLDMQKYGIDKFDLQILEEVEPEQLKETEQQFIEKLQPTYNNRMAYGRDTERYKKLHDKAVKKYNNKLCSYNGETLTLNTLSARFRKSGIEHPIKEAKKYLLDKDL